MQTKLLPSDISQFREEQFWDGFFQERKSVPFEWYGEYAQLAPIIRPKLTVDQNVLIPGCGNSELSAQLYDDGIVNIVNIDFSKVVIREMLTKHLRDRPQMKWMVADMTKTKFENDKFDVVLDKGSLDALMGDETQQSQEVGKKYLREMQRVLIKGEENEGMFICVTLAQLHVLEVLVSSFPRSQWSLVVQKLPSTKDMARSKLQPFLFVAQWKRFNIQSDLSIQINFKQEENAPDADHVAEVIQYLETTQSDASYENFDDLVPGRILQIDVPSKPKSSRYKLTIIDANKDQKQKIRCTVLLIPQGRESEWLFGNPKGQIQVAQQCGAGRLILVAMYRGCKFGSQKEVMRELSQYIPQFAPKDVRFKEKEIPYQTVSEGIGKRKEVARLKSKLNGEIVIEDVVIEEGGEESNRRRLVFNSASQLIQSEAVLDVKKVSAKNKTQKSLIRVNHAVLVSEYHQAMVAALFLKKLNILDSSLTCLLIGLGGGGLPVFFNTCLGIQTEVIELDPIVSEAAQKHFDFQPNQDLQVHICDGLDYISNSKSNNRKFDVIIFDAGSSDPSLPMSCPPPDFIDIDQLKITKDVLSEDNGMLMINCVCRDDEKFDELVSTLKQVFECVYVAEIEDSVNRVLVGFDLKKQECDDQNCYGNMLKEKLKMYDWLDEQLGAFRKL